VSMSPAPWTGAPFGQPQPPPQINRDDEQSSAADQIVFAVSSMLGGVAAGFAGGAVWAAVADPPMAVVTRQGVFLASEVGYDHRAVETLWFLVVGLVGGLLAGALIGLIGRRHGAVTVVAVVLMGAVATGLAAWSGIHVFGPDLGSQLANASPGDQVRTTLTVTSDVAYLGWSIGALIGLLAATAALPGSAFKTLRRTPEIG
jgi:predicted lipid-binding transport protein (Tim44 family)